MDKDRLYSRVYGDLETKLHILNDKPEETVESNIKALWCASAGIHISAQGAKNVPLPDLEENQIKHFYDLIALRLTNVPLAHITNRQNFMGIELIADKRALIPRKETELLGFKALEISKRISEVKGKVYIMDICCGSGNLGIAIACHNPDCMVYAADLSEDAVSLAKENADFLNLNDRISIRQSDLISAFESEEFYNKIDMIVCNPPYIQSSKVPTMEAEISHYEPSLAFNGGMLGTSIIQKLIRIAPKFLVEQGCLIFEVGLGQGKFISEMCERTNIFSNIQSFHDENNDIRVILAET